MFIFIFKIIKHQYLAIKIIYNIDQPIVYSSFEKEKENNKIHNPRLEHMILGLKMTWVQKK